MSGSGDRSADLRLSELYQEVILDHNKHPRNFNQIPEANACAHGVNPLCGDDYYLYLKTDEHGIIRQAGFLGQGCAISKASASMMTTLLLNKNAAEAGELKDRFLKLLTTETSVDEDRKKLGSLKIFEGVRNYPIRVKCATLIWRALEAALSQGSEAKDVSTE